MCCVGINVSIIVEWINNYLAPLTDPQQTQQASTAM